MKGIAEQEDTRNVCRKEERNRSQPAGKGGVSVFHESGDLRKTYITGKTTPGRESRGISKNKKGRGREEDQGKRPKKERR